VLGVEETANRSADGAEKKGPPVSWADVGHMGWPFWNVVVVGVVFTLARFSEAFLILRAAGVGLPPLQVPIIMVVMNLVYALVSTPAGSLSDRVDRRLVLAAGLAVLVAADLTLGYWASVPGALVGAALWGLSNGLTQGLLSAMVADSAPDRLRGTAFGLFNLVTGVALLGASGLAGLLWQYTGPQTTFLAGAIFAALALLGLLAVRRRRP